MQNVSVLITSYLRFYSMYRCAKSVREKYPEIPIMVVDDSGVGEEYFKAPKKEIGYELVNMPEDSGLAAKRNEGLKRLKTDYVVLMDDDFTLDKRSGLDKMKNVLEEDDSLALVAGSLDYGDGKGVRVFAKNLEIDRDEMVFSVLNINEEQREEKQTKKGIRYIYADYFFNFMMMRRKARKVRWNDNLKIGIEHIDFCIRLKENKRWRSAVVPEVIANHYHDESSKRYKKMRRRKDFWLKFYKETGFNLGHNKVDGLTISYKDGEVIPGPEYAFRVNIKMNKKKLLKEV